MISISSDALDVLIDEPPELSKLYLCLASVMDYKTCTAGISYRINHSFLKERLSVAQVNGRKGLSPTPQKIRSVIARMVKTGLVVDKGKYVFHLPYEKAHQSLQKRYNKRYTEGTTKENPYSSVTYKDSDTSNNTRYNTPLSTTSTTTAKLDFSMSDSWLPSSAFAARVKSAGFDIQQVDKLLFDYALVEMKMYWMAEQTNKVRNQIGWELVLLKSMKHLKREAIAESFANAKPRIEAKGAGSKAKAASEGNYAVGVKSKPVGLIIPKVPSYRNQSELLRWQCSAKAPEAKPGEETYNYYIRMLDWRKKQLDKVKYGSVH